MHKGTNKRIRERERIRWKTSTPSGVTGPYATCGVWGCSRSAKHTTTNGLGQLCKYHLELERRHGHPTRGSLTTQQLSPYRYAAFTWIKKHPEEVFVANAIERIRCRLSHAGAVVEAHETRGLSPAKRANAILSRIRAREVAPEILLAVALGVEACLAEDTDPPRSREYARVQYAKTLSRFAGGYVSKWQNARSPTVHTFQAYAQSNGRMLRHLGAALEECTELVVDHHLADVLSMKRTLEAEGCKTMLRRPYPTLRNGVPKKAEVRIVESAPQRPPIEVREVEAPGGLLTIIRL